MDKRENIKLKMYQGLEEVLSRNKDTVATIPAFQIAYDDFRETIAEIVETDKKYLNITNGVTNSKDKVEDQMIDALIALGASSSVYARRSQNEALQETVRVRASKLKRMRDMDLLTKAKAIHTAIDEQKKDLKEYGITKEDVDGLMNKINAFEKAIEVQEDSFAQAKAARQRLGELFDISDDITNLEMDPMAERIKEAHAQFYGDYQKNRVLKDF